MNASTKTPLLFIIFNRPETTKAVFDVIKKYKPTQLYIAADGPRARKLGDNERCEETRKIVEKVDWPCKVKRLYREKNLGCKHAVSGAIDWFFNNVEEGIILEDDCLPDDSFFNFCESMLLKYRDNNKIMHINGSNFQPINKQSNNQYYYSNYPHVWGWATWRRAWKLYRRDINDWWKYLRPVLKNKRLFEKIFWFENFYSVFNNLIDTWDYQWVFAIWKNHGLCITPSVNLVSNIGIGSDSTHTSRSNDIVKNQIRNRINGSLKLKMNSIDIIADKFTSSDVYEIGFYKLPKILLIIPYNYIKGILKKI